MGVGEFNSGIVSYDWSDPNADGTLKLISAAPAPFLIYGDGIGDCSLNGWKGLLDHDTGGVEVLLLDHSQTDEYAAVVTLREGESDGVGGSGENRLDPERTIDGVRGCRPNVEPDDCVLILPIVFNNADCEFCTPYSEPYQFAANGSVTLYFARWGAFLMNAESGGAYSGRMIKNYPLQATGKNQWHRNWQEPITINLVKLP